MSNEIAWGGALIVAGIAISLVAVSTSSCTRHDREPSKSEVVKADFSALAQAVDTSAQAIALRRQAFSGRLDDRAVLDKSAKDLTDVAVKTRKFATDGSAKVQDVRVAQAAFSYALSRVEQVTPDLYKSLLLKAAEQSAWCILDAADAMVDSAELAAALLYADSAKKVTVISKEYEEEAAQTSDGDAVFAAQNVDRSKSLLQRAQAGMSRTGANSTLMARPVPGTNVEDRVADNASLAIGQCRWSTALAYAQTAANFQNALDYSSAVVYFQVAGSVLNKAIADGNGDAKSLALWKKTESEYDEAVDAAWKQTGIEAISVARQQFRELLEPFGDGE